MPFLAAAAPYIGLALTAVQAVNQQNQGDIQKSEAGMQALQIERQANETQAESQRVAIEQSKRARYARSRALAVAGASGAGVSDPTVSNILTGIDTQGDTNFMSALYSGDYQAKALRDQAAATRREGKARANAAYSAAGATALKGGLNFAEDNPTFFSKYAGSTPSSIGMGTGYSDMSNGKSGLDYIDSAPLEYRV